MAFKIKQQTIEHNEQGLLSVIEFEKQKYMTKEQITIEADKYNRSLSKHPMSVQELTEVLVGFYERLQLLQQTQCNTLLHGECLNENDANEADKSFYDNYGNPQ